MKLSLLFSLSCFIFLSSTVFANTKRIAILELEAINTPKVYAKIVRNILEVGLYKTKKYQIVERKQIELIFKEQGLQMSGCIDSSCAIKIGKILSADYMVIGSISKLTSYTVAIKLVDVAKGTIVYADSERARGNNKLEDAVYSMIKKLQSPSKDDNRSTRGKLMSIGVDLDKKQSNRLNYFSLYFAFGTTVPKGERSEQTDDVIENTNNYAFGILWKKGHFVYGPEISTMRFKRWSYGNSEDSSNIESYFYGGFYYSTACFNLGANLTTTISVANVSFGIHATPFVGVGLDLYTGFKGSIDSIFRKSGSVEQNGYHSDVFFQTGFLTGINIYRNSNIFFRFAYGSIYNDANFGFSMYQYNIGFMLRM